MCQRKHFLLGLLVSVFLSLVCGQLFGQQKTIVLTLAEYNAVMNSLTTAENQLKQAKLQIEKLNKLLELQEKISMMQSNLWPQLKTSWSEQENALKAEYYEGLFTGLLVGIPAGAAAGLYGGIWIGITIPLN